MVQLNCIITVTLLLDQTKLSYRRTQSPAREDEDCEEKRWKKYLSLMDRNSSHRDWLLGPQEKMAEGIVREYLG